VALGISHAEWTTIEKASALPPPRVHPASSTTGERRAEISGRAKADSLLRDQEASSGFSRRGATRPRFALSCG